MIPKVIIDDFDTSTIPNCVLTDYDVGMFYPLVLSKMKLMA